MNLELREDNVLLPFVITYEGEEINVLASAHRQEIVRLRRSGEPVDDTHNRYASLDIDPETSMPLRQPENRFIGVAYNGLSYISAILRRYSETTDDVVLEMLSNQPVGNAENNLGLVGRRTIWGQIGHRMLGSIESFQAEIANSEGLSVSDDEFERGVQEILGDDGGVS